MLDEEEEPDDREDCPDCRGKGFTWEWDAEACCDRMERCLTCDGRGKE